jgi:hypothetical protein
VNLRDELKSIFEVNRELTPKIVVNAARKKDSPLHDRFEWNNAVAGEKYREVQAAELIRLPGDPSRRRTGEQLHAGRGRRGQRVQPDAGAEGS